MIATEKLTLCIYLGIFHDFLSFIDFSPKKFFKNYTITWVNAIRIIPEFRILIMTVNAIRIIPEFRILIMTLHRKSTSKV